MSSLRVTASSDVSFGALLRALRHRASLSQEELADRSGLCARTVRNLESGRVRPRGVTARLLADALGLTARGRRAFDAAVRDGVIRQAAIGGMREPAATDRRALSAKPSEAPGQLPMDAYGFVGRANELGRMNEVLASGAGQPTAVMVSVLWGVAGVGKTALAVHWAHRVRDRFPDGQLYVNLRGAHADRFALNEALGGLLDALGLPPDRLPAGTDAQAARYRTMLAGRRVLVVVDDAADAGQVRPLLPSSPGSMVVVTSRDRLTSLVANEGAQPLAVEPLDDTAAEELLVRRLGRGRLAAEPWAAAEIIARCGGHVQTLADVAARAATHPESTLATRRGAERTT